MKITLTNEFHGTSIDIVTKTNRFGEEEISGSQLRRIRETLCGANGCNCGIVRDPNYTLNDCPGMSAVIECR